MLRTRLLKCSLSFLFIFILAGVTAHGQDGPEIADLQVFGDTVVWRPHIGFEVLTMRVVGPDDFLFEGEYVQRDRIELKVTDSSGTPLPDGTYNYELRVVPRNTVRRTPNADEHDDKPGAVPFRNPEQSGVFTILNGALVSPDLVESEGAGGISASAMLGSGGDESSRSTDGITVRDIVHNDDVIIVGSLCVGFDCVNGESFGFDTIRMKENNTRVKFQDTSVGSFPTSDWQLTANDSTSGGANKFSIEDITGARVPFTLTADAPTNSLFVASTGRVGLRTSAPVLDLHISTTNTPATRLEQTSAGGFTAQTWDIAGNEANFFVRDVTGGSRLPFRIRPGAPTSSIDIAASGNVGIGTASPASPVHINNTDGVNGGPATLLVAETGAAENRNLLELRNVGDLRFRMNNTTDPAANWVMSCCSSGFSFTQSGVGVRMLISPNGDLTIPGTLTKGGGAFKIDHPLDPANKYLSHSFVESPDMLNIYNGNVELDENGEATVVMPDWFDSLNNEFRYQLTALDGPAPDLHIAERLDGRTFKIAGGPPSGNVSWLVTGVRQDPFAVAHRIQVEEAKPLADRGTFLFPGYYDQEPKAVTDAVDDDPSQIVAAKNAQIRELEVENSKLQRQLDSITSRVAAIESMLVTFPSEQAASKE